MTCLVEGCDRPVSCKSLCAAHYKKWWRTGVMPTGPFLKEPERTQARIMANVKQLPSGHWIWTGQQHSTGAYGQLSFEGKTDLAHRVAWKVFRGTIPEGMVIDHLCRVGMCVNPDHLQVTTQQVNVIRGDSVQARNAAKTHCKRGHEFTPENTKVYRGKRHCIACKSHPEVVEASREGQRRRYWGKKESAPPFTARTANGPSPMTG